ncbi:hypothetical protein [Prauserella rugosa]|uniref:hypothetical protein n=1 Tax=Prauserella rugosa TaxID=43354 RepID=UPI0004C3DDA5|nr:hypothetical protein [Prauserella rugosa]
MNSIQRRSEPESIDELVSDCRQIPRPEDTSQVPTPRAAPAAQPWTVDEACHAQVAELDAYV